MGAMEDVAPLDHRVNRRKQPELDLRRVGLAQPAPEWWESARCQGDPTELFFATDEALIGRAVAVCEGCMVAGSCLSAALIAEAGGGISVRYGVFGGTVPEARVRIDSAARRRARSVGL